MIDVLYYMVFGKKSEEKVAKRENNQILVLRIMRVGRCCRWVVWKVSDDRG